MRFLSILVDFLVHKIKSNMAAKMPVVMLTILKNRVNLELWYWCLDFSFRIQVFDPACSCQFEESYAAIKDEKKRTGYVLTGAIIKPHYVRPSLTLWHNYSWSSTDSSRLSSDTSSSSSFSFDSFFLKGLLRSSPPAQAQKMVHATWRPVHPQLLPLQARSDSQPHRMSLSTVSGARGTPTSTVRGVRILLTWSASHPNSTGLRGWGSDSRAPYHCATW